VHVEVLFYLVSQDADVNSTDINGVTPLHSVCSRGHVETADFLMRHGADTAPQKFPELTGPYLGQKTPDNVPWLFAKGIVSTRIGMYGTIVFSPDGQEAIWKPESPKMLFSKVESGMWSAPEEFLADGKDSMNVPFYSTDGKRLYFMVGTQEKESIWYVEKHGENWMGPKPFDSVVNSSPMHWQFSLDENGDVYFSSDKIYRARFVDGRYENPEPLPPPINQQDEAHEQYREGNVGPFISPDGDFLIYTKFSASTQYQVQLFISFREKDGSWTEPQNLSEKLQTKGNDSSPIISPDGKYLFFQSVRNGSGASRGLYWVSAKIIEDLKPKELK
jgi:hypothetical protein